MLTFLVKYRFGVDIARSASEEERGGEGRGGEGRGGEGNQSPLC